MPIARRNVQDGCILGPSDQKACIFPTKNCARKFQRDDSPGKKGLPFVGHVDFLQRGGEIVPHVENINRVRMVRHTGLILANRANQVNSTNVVLSTQRTAQAMARFKIAR